MRIIAVLLLVSVSFSAFASADLPFVKYYGRYEVIGCKKIDSSNYSTDWCSAKEMLIENAPACKGAPHTSIFFAFPGQTFNSTCTLSPNVKLPIEEIFNTGDELNPEYFKYNQEDDGSDHYYIRVIADQKIYIYTDFWLKKNPDNTVTSKFKRRETLLDDSNKTKSSFEYEMIMKPVK